jgi:peptidoglycan hydrolase-like protein with peptidoglycan-binding domain
MSVLCCALLITGILLHAQANNSSSVPKAQDTASHPPRVKATHKKGTHRRARKRAHRGQQKIDSQRALQIQQALIREHYLNGKPSGVWDDATQRAMQTYQADNGWQTKTTPDSRALIKLGLGPDHEHLLNPESAMTSQPEQHTVPVSSPAPATNGSSAPVLPQN